MAVGADELAIRFAYHGPDDAQGTSLTTIRQACLDLALLLDEIVPDSREKADALTNLEYVMYQANAAVVRRSR